jgi:hypothetical protein
MTSLVLIQTLRLTQALEPSTDHPRVLGPVEQFPSFLGLQVLVSIGQDAAPAVELTVIVEAMPANPE